MKLTPRTLGTLLLASSAQVAEMDPRTGAVSSSFQCSGIGIIVNSFEPPVSRCPRG